MISCLLVAEQNKELLMKYDESCPTGFVPFPEVNAAIYDKSEKGWNNYNGCGCGRGMGWNHYHLHDGNKQENNKDSQNHSSKGKDNICHRCGMKGYWAPICHTPEHFLTLCQAYMKKKRERM